MESQVLIAEKWVKHPTNNWIPSPPADPNWQLDSFHIKSTTEQRLESLINSDTCPPIQLITNKDEIPSLLDTYLHYIKLSNASAIDKMFNIEFAYT